MLKDKFKIDQTSLGAGAKPYIIAELSANHSGSLDLAIKSIQAAAKAGASAIKLQHYRADTLSFDDPRYQAGGAWAGQSLYELYEKAAMPWEWTGELFSVAKECGISIFSSPFDASAVELLEKFDAPAYKIASPELVELELIALTASTKKPLIISTGNASLAQLDTAVQTAIKNGCSELAILKCTSNYPSLPSQMNLSAINALKQIYGCPVGLSDHTKGIAVPIASVALGASVVEKHFMLDKDVKSVDSFFSLSADELEELVQGCTDAYEAIGLPRLEPLELPIGRSLIAIADIARGEQIQIGQNVKSLRPGGGLAPSFASIINNRPASKDIKAGDMLQWDMI